MEEVGTILNQLERTPDQFIICTSLKTSGGDDFGYPLDAAQDDGKHWSLTDDYQMCSNHKFQLVTYAVRIENQDKLQVMDEMVENSTWLLATQKFCCSSFAPSTK